MIERRNYHFLKQAQSKVSSLGGILPDLKGDSHPRSQQARRRIGEGDLKEEKECWSSRP